MKAAVLNAFGEALNIQTMPDPSPGAGSVVVDVMAAGVTGYAANVFDGSRGYRLDLPAVPGPGGIGRVRAAGPDATRLKPGDWVFCEPTVRARDEASDQILQGWTYRTDAARPLHLVYHDGAYAEQMRVPTENVTRIGDIDAKDAGRWCGLSRLLVPYGGLWAGDLKAGETLLVSGATGGFGGAGVAVALAMSAGQVVATGRNAQTLGDLAARFGSRVKPVAMTGDEAADRAAIAKAAGGPIDMVLDFLPREASLSQVNANMMAVRHGGRIMLMGGVRAKLGLDYNWLMHGEITLRGVWMYPPQAVPRMVRMVRAGLIDLHQFDLAEFALDDANAAVAYAAANAGPRQLTVIRPNAG
jgi:alcohol dehydrogenase